MANCPLHTETYTPSQAPGNDGFLSRFFCLFFFSAFKDVITVPASFFLSCFSFLFLLLTEPSHVWKMSVNNHFSKFPIILTINTKVESNLGVYLFFFLIFFFNWHITLYSFQEYDIMIWQMYIFQSDYCNKPMYIVLFNLCQSNNRGEMILDLIHFIISTVKLKKYHKFIGYGLHSSYECPFMFSAPFCYWAWFILFFTDL